MTNIITPISLGENGDIVQFFPFVPGLDYLARAAKTDGNILITGETGAGKELAARYAHEHSMRRTKPYFTVNCAALTESLFEAQFFGHEKGAYTGAHVTRPGLIESAQGGTLFLDEIAEIPPSLQAKLLRFLQNGEIIPIGSRITKKVDVRIIAATNCDVEEQMRSGKLRSDLYHRISQDTFQVPPLRTLKEHIPALACFLLSEDTQQRLQKGQVHPQRTLDAGALTKLANYGWPGNVRELKNVIHRANTHCDTGVISADHIIISDQRPLTLITQNDLEKLFETMIVEGLKSGKTNMRQEFEKAAYAEANKAHHSRNMSYKTIAAILGVHKNTVARHRTMQGNPSPDGFDKNAAEAFNAAIKIGASGILKTFDRVAIQTMRQHELSSADISLALGVSLRYDKRLVPA